MEYIKLGAAQRRRRRYACEMSEKGA